MTQETPQTQAAAIVAAQRWLALATTDDQGVPHISYAPFAPIPGAFGIVVSRLAQHTAQLVAGKPAAIMLVGPSANGDPYAQARFSIDVVPRVCPAESAQAREIWSALEARHGETAGVLRTLSDFQAIALEPTGGRLVLGFASAHSVDAASIREMLR